MTPPVSTVPAPTPGPPVVPVRYSPEELEYGTDVSESIAQALYAPPSPISFLESGPDGIPSQQYTFPYALSELRDQLDTVLLHKDDPEELEHQAILFWPSFSRLLPWLGKGRRESELVAALTTLRAQFRLQPVTAAVLMALRTVLHKAATATVLTEDLVVECLDLLEEAGADLRLPLSFAAADED